MTARRVVALWWLRLSALATITADVWLVLILTGASGGSAWIAVALAVTLSAVTSLAWVKWHALEQGR